MFTFHEIGRTGLLSGQHGDCWTALGGKGGEGWWRHLAARHGGGGGDGEKKGEDKQEEEEEGEAPNENELKEAEGGRGGGG